MIVTQDLHTSKGGTICRLTFLPPANKVCEGYVFTPVCHSVHRGGGGLPNPPPRCRPPPDADPLQMQTCHAHPHAYPPPSRCRPPGCRPAMHTPMHAPPPPPMQTPPPPSCGILRDTVNKRAVHIILKCILVINSTINIMVLG